jgi:methylmalonyl-CoA epimerase
LAERGPGIHHVAYLVDDIEKALATLRERGVRLVDERPRLGVGGKLIAFVHPKDTLGVLTELVQLPGVSGHPADGDTGGPTGGAS